MYNIYSSDIEENYRIFIIIVIILIHKYKFLDNNSSFQIIGLFNFCIDTCYIIDARPFMLYLNDYIE